MTKKELKELIKEVISESVNNTNNYLEDMSRLLKQAKKKGDHEQSAYYTQALSNGGSAYASWDKFKGSWAYEQWIKKPETQKLIKAIKDEYDRFSHMRENSTNEEYTTDGDKKAAKERIVKLKAEYDRINKLKGSSDYLDTNDPQARNFHNKRLKEIPKEISKIRQKMLDI